jgi:oxygen-independent coproporphyrinogen-3 oxidase
MGIYIHIPFCLHKCDYCDFYSVPVSNLTLLEDYTCSVINELEIRQNEICSPFTTIYLGGGTPSLLSPSQIERILAAVFAHYQWEGEPEISMEVNPATVNLIKLKALRAAGINRMSIGVQSFSDRELKILGRIHNGREAQSVLSDVSNAGFDNFNIDLIYGLPGQTLTAWLENLSRAMNYNPQHISAYLLQLDQSTPMALKIDEGILCMLDDELEASLYYAALDYLGGQGYRHYEISNFAQLNGECQHNLLYWQGRQYLGIGSGAVSFDGKQRSLNQPPVESYVQALLDHRPPSTKILENMDSRQRLIDAVILGLRLTEGINRNDFQQRFGIDILKDYQDIIRNCQLQGLLELEDNRIYMTKRAYFLSNQVLSQFI